MVPGRGLEPLWPCGLRILSPPEFRCTGPRLHPFAVVRDFWGHFHPSCLVLAGSPERDLKCVGTSFFLGASSCSSVLLPGARLKTKETMEMPVCGKHEKAMKRFPTLPTVLGNRCGYFSHSHRRDYDGIYFQVPPVKRYEG